MWKEILRKINFIMWRIFCKTNKFSVTDSSHWIFLIALEWVQESVGILLTKVVRQKLFYEVLFHLEGIKAGKVLHFFFLVFCHLYLHQDGDKIYRYFIHEILVEWATFHDVLSQSLYHSSRSLSLFCWVVC